MTCNNESHDLPDLPPSVHSEDVAATEKGHQVGYKHCDDRDLQEYQRMVADRDKEIRRLECKLEKSERELKRMRVEVDRGMSGVKSCGK